MNGIDPTVIYPKPKFKFNPSDRFRVIKSGELGTILEHRSAKGAEAYLVEMDEQPKGKEQYVLGQLIEEARHD